MWSHERPSRVSGGLQLDPSLGYVDSVARIANASAAIYRKYRKIKLSDTAWVPFCCDDENLVKDKF